MKKLFLFFALSFFFLTCFAQKKKTDSSFYTTFDKAIKVYLAEDYDSAAFFFSKAIAIAEKQHKFNEEKYTTSLTNLGVCFTMQQHPQEAHEQIYKGLLNARKYKHLIPENNALFYLNILHNTIIEKKWNFHYPDMNATYGSYVFFPILTVEPLKNSDSLQIIVSAGRYDGITDSSYNSRIYKRYDSVYKNHEDVKNNNSIGYGRIVLIENNRTILHIKPSSTLNIEAKDLANMYCQTPIMVKKSYYIKLLDNAIGLYDNSKTGNLISRRFLLYYNDDKINFEFIKVLKEELLYVQKAFANDTLDANNLLSTKATAGMFKGVNIIKALDSTNTRHITGFINFVNKYPGKYFGNGFSFSEVYATWLLNNTPMADDDILYYIVGTEKNKRADVASALKNDIDKYSLVENWVTQALNAFDKNDLLNVRVVLLGLGAVYASEKNIEVGAWLRFINGMYQYKIGDISYAETELAKASDLFSKANNAEGLSIVQQAIQKIHSNNKIVLEAQSGEFAAYIVAMHPSGKYYATRDYNSTIRVWDIQLGKIVRTFQAHDDAINAIAYSPNGRYFATCSDDSTIKIWSTFNYTVITSIKTNSIEYSLAFSPNNKELASGGNDSLIKIWNILTGEKQYSLKKHKGIVTQLCYVGRNEDILFSSGTDSMVYHWNLFDRVDVRWYNKKAKLLNMKVSYNGNYMFYTANDSTINVWDLYKGKFYFKEKISVAQYGTSRNFTEPDFSPDGSLLTYADEYNRVVIVDLNAGYFKSIAKGAYKGAYLNTLNFTTDQKGIFATYPFMGKTKLFDISEYKSIQTFNTDVEVKTNVQYTNPNTMVQFSKNGQSIFTASNRIIKYNFSNSTTEFLLQSPQFIYNETFMLNDSISFISNDYNEVGFLNHASRKEISSITLPNNDTIAQYVFNEKKNILYLVSIHGSIKAFAVKDFVIHKEVIFSAQINLNDNKLVSIVKWDSVSNHLLIATKGEMVDMYKVNVLSGKITALPSLKNFGDFVIADNYIYFNNHNGTITKNNIQTLQVEKEFNISNDKNVAGFMKLSPNKKLIAAYYNDTNFVVIDIEKEKILYTKKAHDIYAMGLAFSPNSQYILTGGFDTKLNLFKATTGSKLLNIFTPSTLDFVAADTVGNYMASKNSLDGLSFKLNENIYPFEQFDMQFNRPDLVLAQSGMGDSVLIEAYKKAVEKRFQKNKSAIIPIDKLEQLPTLTITDNTDVSYFTNLNYTELTLNCFHATQPISTLHISVNNNPIYGFAGKKLGNNSNDTSFTVKIPLAAGKNEIKIYCTNALAQNSLQQTFEVRCNSKEDTAAKTWFIGIGVSNYKDKNMNLQYAAKDIRDLTQTFTKGKKNIEIDTLIDSKATLQNILSIRKKLLAANPNDKVIVAVTGHGLLDKNLDFYYATYDIDFNNPTKKGLKYEMLEYILDSVPAQKKLLLIDACHSGALDKEALQTDTAKLFVPITDTSQQSEGKVITASRSTIKNKKPSKVSLNNTFELMKNMFSDFANNNGSMVISAAGGLEFAFESPTWNNGVFTYSIRKGLESLEADDEGNFDLTVSVNELMRYVSKKVIELTNGQQRPTSRRELVGFDWEL
ncbi:MAG: caspase family protein [Chitinophagaceae bacterium]|nr:caspase family protein [Chitinophagaceae bacterium]MCW5904515.1 caspase family protein [Chitinophagaceae bacterium]